MPNIGQTLLYIAGGGFPLLGLNGFFQKYKKQIKAAEQHEHRMEHQKSLRETRERRLAGTDGDDRMWELNEVDAWHDAELAKLDPWGTPYSESDQVMSYYSPGAASLATRHEWKHDLRFVFIGIVCATGASIWAVWF